MASSQASSRDSMPEEPAESPKRAERGTSTFGSRLDDGGRRPKTLSAASASTAPASSWDALVHRYTAETTLSWGKARLTTCP